ncbi:MAG: DUF4336 domain-containing protein [Burkholderiales bacterium]|nr:MAG: DUF4336 domain-containing protein [Burkholderiales bacterium]
MSASLQCTLRVECQLCYPPRTCGDASVAKLETFGDDIWIASGPVVTSMGFRYPTRMAIIRLASGKLFIWSPVAISPDLRADVEALGEVGFIVAPNSLHYVFLKEWSAAYPQAAVYAAPGVRERCKDIAFAGELGDEAPAAWAGEIDQAPMRGNLITTEIVFFHRKSGAVLFTDLIQHFRPGWFKGVQALIAKMDGMTGPAPRVPQKFRTAFVDRKAARASLSRILSWPAQKVLMAHAEPVMSDAQAFIARTFAWLR